MTLGVVTGFYKTLNNITYLNINISIALIGTASSFIWVDLPPGLPAAQIGMQSSLSGRENAMTGNVLVTRLDPDATRFAVASGLGAGGGTFPAVNGSVLTISGYYVNK